MNTTMPRMTGEQRMLAACRREAVDATPIWFMRQAGRCLADYRELRKRYDILTLTKTPELCTQVTTMPLDAFGVDAAVMFADIMLPMEAMGISFYIEPEVGPIINNPIRSAADVDRLQIVEAEESTPYVFEAMRMVRREIEGRAALVGFSGAPFTLATYLVEGRPSPSREYPTTRGLMVEQPAVWHRLMSTLTEVILRYLHGQIAAGAQILQLFDSWVGALSPDEYKEFVLPYSRKIFEGIAPTGIPTIHFGRSTGQMLDLIAAAGSDIISVDWEVPLDRAWDLIGHDRGIQGNLDSNLLLESYEAAEAGAAAVLALAAGRAGHIFNLGHGVLPDTRPADLARLVEFVHAQTARN